MANLDRRPMKKFCISISAVIVAIAAVSIAVCFVNTRFFGEEGVKKVAVAYSAPDKTVLTIEYGRRTSEYAHCSVRMLDKDEKIYWGNRLVEDSDLGDYRMEILFHNMRASETLANEYPIGTVHRLKDVPADQSSAFNIRIAYPPDDSLFAVYIGSDQPIGMKEPESIPLDDPKHCIELVMKK